MNSLLLSMPGTPVIYYGDEIGMGDNIHLGDRDGVRTPMQWSLDRNGGFSRADPGSAGAAADHGPAVRLRGGQCRSAERAIRIRCSTGCGACSRCASRSSAFGRGTHAIPVSGQPQGARLSARVRRRNGDPVRRQSVALAAGGRTRSVANSTAACRSRCSAVRAFPADRPTAVSADACRPMAFYWFELRPATRVPAWHAPAPPSRCPNTSRW